MNEPDTPEPPLPRALAIGGIVLYCACAALAALIQVSLVTWHVGSWTAPISILLAVGGNIAIPMFSRRLTGSLIAGLLPILVWAVTVIILSMGRPEGDVLLPGNGADALVAYGTLLGGLIAGVVTLGVIGTRSQHARGAHPSQPVAQPDPTRPSVKKRR